MCIHTHTQTHIRTSYMRTHNFTYTHTLHIHTYTYTYTADRTCSGAGDPGAEAVEISAYMLSSHIHTYT